jgi:hypothetical protein
MIAPQISLIQKKLFYCWRLSYRVGQSEVWPKMDSLAADRALKLSHHRKSSGVLAFVAGPPGTGAGAAIDSRSFDRLIFALDRPAVQL